MWLARMSLLVHTEQFRKAEAELDSFSSLDNPDLYYQYHAHSYPGKKGMEGGGEGGWRNSSLEGATKLNFAPFSSS